MASSACRLTSSRARSSRLHRVAGQSCSAVRSDASVTTSSRSSGGKDRWATGSRSVLESRQAVPEEARPPQGDGVAATDEFGGDGAIGGMVVLGQPEDDAGAEGEGLWAGRRPGEGLELAAECGGPTHDGGMWDGHRGIRAEVVVIRDRTSLTDGSPDSRATAQGLTNRTSSLLERRPEFL